MAMTHDYLDYLNQRVGIAPANSQEELQAAQTIANLMSHHDVEPSVEEFDAPALSNLFPAILSILMFVGVLVSGVGVVALAVIGLILASIPTILAALRLFGRAPSLSFGPSARSQNVVAVHRATGPLVAKGNRPVVVVAHYDTPRENFLYSMPFAPYLPLIVKAAALCRYAVALCAFIQVLGFIPAPARIVFWLLGIVASLPAVLLAAGSIYERVSPCTLGANDNKASVAALLGVMENVRPSGLVPLPREPERPQADVPSDEDVAPEEGQEPLDQEVPADSDAAPAPVPAPASPAPASPAPAPVKVVGTRHGADVLRSLEILPESCEIEYVTPEPASEPVASPASAPSAAAPASLFDIDPLPEPEEEPEGTGEPEAAPEPEAAEEAVDEADETSSIEGTVPLSPVPDAAEGDAETTREDLLSGGRFSLVMDDDPRGVGPKGSSGLTTIDAGALDPDATQPAPQPAPARPAAPDDPEWGTSTYRPQVSNVARRASLFDLPDPSLNESDPLGDPDATRVSPSKLRFGRSSAPAPAAAEDEPAPESAPEVAAPEPIETLASTAERGKGALSSLLGRIKGALAKRAEKSEEEEEQSGDWLGSSADEDDPVWKGGAAVRGGLRFVDEDEAESVPTEEEMVDEILTLGDDALVCHDVWFVALGGSSLDHAGMRSFLQQHRQEIRGCFIVNLDCVGAGELSVLTREGAEGTRRTDRRLGRILTNVANDLHAELAQKSFDWTTTDAWPAMSSSMRSVTIMGVNEHGLPALSHTADDVAENVSGDQATLVTELVTEAIRRA